MPVPLGRDRAAQTVTESERRARKSKPLWISTGLNKERLVINLLHTIVDDAPSARRVVGTESGRNCQERSAQVRIGAGLPTLATGGPL